MSKSIKSLKQDIYNILSKEWAEKYRDCDYLLAGKIWTKELRAQGIKIEKINAVRFIYLQKEKKISSYDTITRARRKCNEMHSNTIGKSYKNRKDKEKEVKQEIREIGHGKRNGITR